MKTPRAFQSRRGFTLIELLVAMTITTIIVGVLVSITSIAIDTWNRSRSELRAARQAKTMVDGMVRDFEALVVRKGNANEWLSAVWNQPSGANEPKSTNTANLIFFTAATDRYNGEIGTTADKGGDVSCVGYRLFYKDPISQSGNEFKTFVLNRILVNPDATFQNLLGKTDLDTAFAAPYSNDLGNVENFVCENVFQFTVSFKIEVTKNTTTPPAAPVYRKFVIPVDMFESNKDQKVKEFSLLGTGINADVAAVTIDGVEIKADEIKAGLLTAVEISLTVLSDGGVNLLRKSPTKVDGTDGAAWLAKNSFQYSKLIQLPGM